MLRLSKRFFKAAVQRIATPLLRLHGLLEQGLTPRSLRCQDTGRFVELRLVRPLWFTVRYDAAEIGIHHQ